MLRLIHIPHPRASHRRAAAGRIEPVDEAPAQRPAHAPNCGYRLEAAARRVGVASRFVDEQSRGG